MKKKEFTRMADGSRLYSEIETRRRILNSAEYWGIRRDIEIILARYDSLLSRCTNEQERKAIAVMGAQEVHNMFNMKGDLIVDGKTVIEAKEDK